MSLWWQTGLITLGFAGAYVGLRNIPQQNCEFLHYESVGQSVDGGEVCSSSAPPLFLDLTRLRFPVELRLRPETKVEPGRPAYFTLELVTDGGQILLPHELAIVHTERLHLLLLDESLGDYHHIHPEPQGGSGSWSFQFTPREGGRYRAIAEVVPLLTKRQVVADSWIEVPGEGTPARLSARQTVGEVQGYRFSLTAPQGQLPREFDNALELKIDRPDGGPGKLQSIMGEVAHMVAFDKDRAGYAHLHPVQTGAEHDATAPRMAFTFNTAKPGNYRLWAQVKLEDQERFVPFDLTVE
ncbi:MAG: hypothetical protein ACFB20_02815 [Opitutales bacterium]